MHTSYGGRLGYGHFYSVCQLQSILEHLMYIHKCVKSSGYFVNRILELLRTNYDGKSITLSQGFKRDIIWFQKQKGKHGNKRLYLTCYLNGKILFISCNCYIVWSLIFDWSLPLLMYYKERHHMVSETKGKTWKQKTVSDLLSRWQNTVYQLQLLYCLVPNLWLVPAPLDVLQTNNEI